MVKVTFLAFHLAEWLTSWELILSLFSLFDGVTKTFPSCNMLDHALLQPDLLMLVPRQSSLLGGFFLIHSSATMPTTVISFMSMINYTSRGNLKTMLVSFKMLLSNFEAIHFILSMIPNCQNMNLKKNNAFAFNCWRM